MYRFSLSWARIVPNGHVRDGINLLGLDYYSQFIDALRVEGIEPFVTLYHWDLPLQLLHEGGWLNETIADHFADYSKVVYQALGNRVKYWASFNEPWIFCGADWNYGYHNPWEEPPEKMYNCSHNVIKAHGLAYRIYDSEFRPIQRGLFGIAPNLDYPEALNESDPNDVEASERAIQFRVKNFTRQILLVWHAQILHTRPLAFVRLSVGPIPASVGLRRVSAYRSGARRRQKPTRSFEASVL